MNMDYVVLGSLLLLIFFQFCVILKLNNRGNDQMQALFGNTNALIQELQTVAHAQHEFMIKIVEHNANPRT